MTDRTLPVMPGVPPVEAELPESDPTAVVITVAPDGIVLVERDATIEPGTVVVSVHHTQPVVVYGQASPPATPKEN